MAKIQPNKADAYLSRLPQETVVVVLYGPDAGLVSDRGSAAIKAFLGSGPDKVDTGLAIVNLRAGDLKGDPARLVDEARSPSLLGGKRVVRLTEAPEAVAAALADLATSAPGEVLVVIEAGDLKPSSALRKAAEASGSSVAAIGCYPLDNAAMGGFITETARANGLMLDTEAHQVLLDAIGSDRAVARRQIEKIALYLDEPVSEAGSTAESRHATADDVRQCVGDSAERSLDDLALAVADGAIAIVGRTFHASLEQGATTVGILRAAQRHLLKLVPAVDARESGMPAAKAVAEIKPPVFWKHRDRVISQVGRWGSASLRSALDRLLEAEIQCKSTGIPDVSLAERTLFQIARLSGRPGR
ncbi:DNA polymerase III subunit delta [Fodinicurvata sp. EGI_FJ10296]|uniref:DNA polymerase III subunit delta n=1 Tax=Fodinicurvata sp. EGI_FJ10296 TaxID=3231908 RepID=UPI003456A28B